MFQDSHHLQTAGMCESGRGHESERGCKGFGVQKVPHYLHSVRACQDLETFKCPHHLSTVQKHNSYKKCNSVRGCRSVISVPANVKQLYKRFHHL